MKDFTREQAIKWCLEKKCNFIDAVFPPPSGWAWVIGVPHLTLAPLMLNTGQGEEITLAEVEAHAHVQKAQQSIWAQCGDLTKHHEVHNALDVFSDDPTQDNATFVVMAVHNAIQPRPPRLSWDEFVVLAKEAFGQKVDNDLRGNPITDYDVLLMGAYGPAVRRLVHLAVERLAIPEKAEERPERCCCPPKGFTGAWGAGPCPVHQGFGAIQQKRKEFEARRERFEAFLVAKHHYQPYTLRTLRLGDTYQGISLPLAWSAWNEVELSKEKST